jgi:hypothetical protein
VKPADVFDLNRVSGGVTAQLIAYEPWRACVDPNLTLSRRAA